MLLFHLQALTETMGEVCPQWKSASVKSRSFGLFGQVVTLWPPGQTDSKGGYGSSLLLWVATMWLLLQSLLKLCNLCRCFMYRLMFHKFEHERGSTVFKIGDVTKNKCNYFRTCSEPRLYTDWLLQDNRYSWLVDMRYSTIHALVSSLT